MNIMIFLCVQAFRHTIRDRAPYGSPPPPKCKLPPPSGASNVLLGSLQTSPEYLPDVKVSDRGLGFPATNIKFGPKWVENPRFGLKLGPEACQDRSGALGGGLTHSKGPSPAWSWSFKSGPQCRFGPKSSKMARNGSRIDRLV